MNDETPFVDALCNIDQEKKIAGAAPVDLHIRNMSYAYAVGSNALLFPRCTLSCPALAFSARSRLDPLNCMDAEGKLYPLPARFANINFALFVMNIQHMISSNQLSNILTRRVCRNYRRASKCCLME